MVDVITTWWGLLIGSLALASIAVILVWLRSVRQILAEVRALVSVIADYAADAISWLQRHWLARSVKQDVEGHVNAWITRLNRRMPVDLKVPRISIRFHDKSSVMEILQDGKLLMFFNRNEERPVLYSHAIKWVVGTMAIPSAHRPYFESYICEAFDLTVARMLLADRDPAALEAFEQHMAGPAMKNDHRVARYCLRFETVQEAGFFTRVLWPEMRDFGERSQGRLPSVRLKRDSARFVRWIHDMAARPHGSTAVPLQFMSANIRVAFCLVRDNVKALPLSVYADHISEDLDAGCGRVYVLARGRSIPLVEEIADRFRNDVRVARVIIHKFEQAVIDQSVLDEALKGAAITARGSDARLEYDKLAGRYEEDDDVAGATRPTRTVRAICATIISNIARDFAMGEEYLELTPDLEESAE